MKTGSRTWIVVLVVSVLIIGISVVFLLLAASSATSRYELQKDETATRTPDSVSSTHEVQKAKERENTNTEATTAEKRTVPVEALQFMNSGIVGPGGVEWVTERVDYRCSIRTEGHAFFIQFSSSRGGWTEKVFVPEEGDLGIIPLPRNAAAGPLRITAGPKETRMFRVQLYKKIVLR
jgi:hypothetical protein